MCLGEIGHIRATWDEGGVPMATVDTAAGPRTTCLLYLPDARPGDAVLMHLGMAVEQLTADQAQAALDLRRGAFDPTEPLP